MIPPYEMARTLMPRALVSVKASMAVPSGMAPKVSRATEARGASGAGAGAGSGDEQARKTSAANTGARVSERRVMMCSGSARLPPSRIASADRRSLGGGGQAGSIRSG